tara:strand:+ start:25003 stop:26268 length:1266 start_codon:yes stop_codon:yes gene_type:complete
MAKSILEEALLQVSQLEEAVKNNAKEILASTMKQEIDELVRESMEEPQEEVEASLEMDTTEEVSEESTKVEGTELEEQIEGSEDEDESEESDDDELEGESEDNDDDESEELEDFDSKEESEEDTGFGDIEMPTLELPSLDDEEDEVIDMTGASDEEILKVFKSMGEEDGIIVSQEEDGTVHLEDGDDEYRIEVNKSEDEESEEDVSFDEVSESTDPIEESSDEEVVYEIELDEEVSDEEVAEEVTETEEITDESEEDEETPEADMEEASRTHAADARVPSNQGKKYKAGRADLSEDIKTLKSKNGELTEALKVFRDKLNEVGVFNANLAYATRLFTEHTTTKSEKLNILKRFDGIETLKESKSLYNSIKNELTGSDIKLTETVVNKISSSPKSGSSEKLVESKTYENPQIRRIKEMMGIVK